MQALGYYLLLPLLYGLSYLPMRVLYVVSDGLYVLLHYGIRYRKKVVLKNLRNSFPEKSERDIQRLYKQYDAYLCDLLVEVIKKFTISASEVARRVSFTGLEPVRAYHAQGQPILIVLGHYGNWEWAGQSMTQQGVHRPVVVYKKLNNLYFDGLIYRSRTRFGDGLIEFDSVMREMVRQRRELNMTCLLADQTPEQDKAYWTEFLHQDTSMFTGPEKLAQKFGYPIFYAGIQRRRRGYYEVVMELVSDQPAETEPGEISEKWIRMLERDIRRDPVIWLWSHNKWKHKRPSAILANATK